MEESKQKETKKIICPECRGNGYVRVPYHLAKEEIWANCDECDSEGEIVVEKYHLI